jgi:site-specific DNA-methyltransferase (adenine-specific)
MKNIKTKHKIIIGDSRSMAEVQSGSVHLIITSPPYWQLKDYGTKNQIGYNSNYEDYINNLNLVWKECYRALDNGCRLCINIGDQFARAVYYGRYKVIPIRTEIIKFCESIGFDYMGSIIWQKKTTTNTTGGASVMGSFPLPRNGIISIDYEFILIFKKLGKTKVIERWRKEKSKLSKEEWKQYFTGHWNFGGVKQKEHIAMFPEELPTRLIKMFAFMGDVVLDPFLGSGTTTLAAKKLNRNSIGYEINDKFIPVIKRKLHIEQKSLFDTDIVFIRQEKKEMDYQNAIKKLPYIFKDCHKLDKKIDPKKLQFGSKIDENKQDKNVYYTVKDVISSNILKLNNDVRVRLIGIKEKQSCQEKAINFLTKKTMNQKVYMKFDEQKYDKHNNLFCYLYLKNKTFINAHLIKEGLVEIDKSTLYQYRDKFINLEK